MDVLDALERLGTGGDIEEMNRLIQPVWQEKIPRQKRWILFDFCPTDLILLMGFSVSDKHARLFAPSSIESSRKRLDGGLDATSKPVRLSLRPSETGEERCSDNSSYAKHLALGRENGTSMTVEGGEGVEEKSLNESRDSEMVGEGSMKPSLVTESRFRGERKRKFMITQAALVSRCILSHFSCPVMLEAIC